LEIQKGRFAYVPNRKKDVDYLYCKEENETMFEDEFGNLLWYIDDCVDDDDIREAIFMQIFI